ncbi:MAG TPA: hypothetical protein PLQ15_07155 [Syntrophales bacterium]|nr:hypothetical protein [Syntrophobacterales bacterium]HNQ01524.1 hypothetical protein [Syntrophales bacterium]HNS53205.1 hypothetical protein [Syntrophales bacterium]HQL90363.1 hypothetical protein [Syntrophales bacterium]
MIVTDGTALCRVCNERKSVVLCDGCSIPLCAECRRWDLWGYGCGHVDTKSFCAACYESPVTNPYGGNHGA